MRAYGSLVGSVKQFKRWTVEITTTVRRILADDLPEALIWRIKSAVMTALAGKPDSLFKSQKVLIQQSQKNKPEWLLVNKPLLFEQWRYAAFEKYH